MAVYIYICAMAVYIYTYAIAMPYFAIVISLSFIDVYMCLLFGSSLISSKHPNLTKLTANSKKHLPFVVKQVVMQRL